MLCNIITIVKCQNIFKSNLNLQWQLYFKPSVSYGSSEIIPICWFDAQEAFIIIISVINSYSLTIESSKHFFK